MNDEPQGRGANVIREVSVGLSVLGVLFSMFVAAAYQRFGGPTVPPPAAINSIKQSIVGKQGSQNSVPDEQPVYRTASRPAELSSSPIEATPAPNINSTNGGVPSHSTNEVDTPAASYVPNPDSLESPPSNSFDVNQDDLPPALESVDTQFETTSETDLLPGDDFSPVPDDLEPLEVPATQEPFSLVKPPNSIPILQQASVVLRDERHTAIIRQNDSFWTISLRAYGNGDYFRALYEANRADFPDPDELPIGAVVLVPELDDLRRRFPSLSANRTVNLVSAQQPPNGLTPTANSERTYIARKGDTLFDIARLELGQASRFVEILQLNQRTLGQGTERIPAGMHLRLPID